ncbi:hypothetical protein SETIT_9G100000v2 [Setaria italica]|uniref:Uncharacterized protein n=2 Tax=Setaria TaxID=4554 RepID=A0A368SEX1_SETIT|nr:hypothetical protein SETIT_9G100000v2 [Setaria italica]TKV91463.1 hypothetical protein SEVIR_9G098300v2 [Setaria viridis]
MRRRTSRKEKEARLRDSALDRKVSVYAGGHSGRPSGCPLASASRRRGGAWCGDGGIREAPGVRVWRSRRPARRCDGIGGPSGERRTAALAEPIRRQRRRWRGLCKRLAARLEPRRP